MTVVSIVFHPWAPYFPISTQSDNALSATAPDDTSSSPSTAPDGTVAVARRRHVQSDADRASDSSSDAVIHPTSRDETVEEQRAIAVLDEEERRDKPVLHAGKAITKKLSKVVLVGTSKKSSKGKVLMNAGDHEETGTVAVVGSVVEGEKTAPLLREKVAVPYCWTLPRLFSSTLEHSARGSCVFAHTAWEHHLCLWAHESCLPQIGVGMLFRQSCHRGEQGNCWTVWVQQRLLHREGTTGRFLSRLWRKIIGVSVSHTTTRTVLLHSPTEGVQYTT